MLNKRLSKIASLVPQNSVPLDVGTDHGLLPIYLVKNNICPKALASDISPNALVQAKKNIQKYEASNISLYETDGLKDIPKEYNIIILSGMGTKTILSILNTEDLPNNLIISSNNDLKLLRKTMNKKGYSIKKELVVYEKNKYYDIILYEKGYEKLSLFVKEYGKSNDIDYYKHLYRVQKKIYDVANISKKLKLKSSMKRLKKAIEKRKDC